MKRLPEIDQHPLPGCFIAGGAVLSTVTKTPINDYDVYPKNTEAFESAIDTLMSDGHCINITNKAVTIKTNDVKEDGERTIYQVMRLGFPQTPQDIFDKFDFSVTMGAYDCDTKEYTFAEDFWPDVASKTIHFNTNTLYPLASLLRVNKYKEKGYYIPKTEFIKMAFSISENLPKSWEEVEMQLGGVYGNQFRLSVDQGLEFSVQNLYNVLDEMNTDFEVKENTEFSGMNADTVIILTSSRPLEYVEISSGTEFLEVGQTKIAVKLDTYFVPLTIEKIPSHWVNCADTLFDGYKLVAKHDDGTYSPGVYNNSKLVYQMGVWHKEDNHPHFFVHQRSNLNGYYSVEKIVKVRVQYFAKDIFKVNANGDIQVKKFKLVEEYE